MEKKIGKIKYVVPQSYVSRQFAKGKDSVEIRDELRATIKKCMTSVDLEEGINVYASGEEIRSLRDMNAFSPGPWDFVISNN